MAGELDSSYANADLIVQIARLALTGRPQDLQLFIRRMVKKYQVAAPQLAEQLTDLLRESPTRSSPLRREAPVIPVDLDSRLQLVRTETVTQLPVEPVYDPAVWHQLQQIAAERSERGRLEKLGLAPTRSVLLTGSPGVGKTLAARWLSRELHVPLLTLDLAAVMSSFLGRTGNNLRYVLDYAKSVDCILLLDEFDAIAKRRDDSTEVGELKRLVTVLLQEIDDWPPSSLLVAATNHPALLDPAVWRRFEMAIEFPMPTPQMVESAVQIFMGADAAELKDWVAILGHVLRRSSFSEIEREITIARRAAAIRPGSTQTCFVQLVRSRATSLPRPDRIRLAEALVRTGAVSQRDAHELTGVSRDTIRKSIRNAERSTAAG